MKQVPFLFKVVINFVAYVGYTALLSLVFSFLFPITLKLFGKEPLNPSDPVFVKIQVSIAIIILFVTIIFRKYFYVSLSSNKTFKEVIKEDISDVVDNKINTAPIIENVDKTKDDFVNVFSYSSYEDNIKEENKSLEEIENKRVEEFDDDDGIKILIDKEIKR
ncbi:MAG: hypothetical protein PHN31_06085 [Candidatus Gracilibacteria bacterium]|nr:hypothetical protein [Candidatus Gracilibacteria bacterium]